MRFDFDGRMDLEVLKNYLSYAVTASGLIDSDTLTDDLRVIEKLGTKFVGRASGIWYMPMEDELHFTKSERLAQKVHAQDPEIILQACVFEWVVKRMEEITIPEHVLAAFDQPIVQRNFVWREALYPNPPAGMVDNRELPPSKQGGIPDLSRLEARMWFYYRATRYIDCGYEALHLGQIHITTSRDQGLVKTQELLDKIRQYAKAHARRHKVLLDAHTHGINVDGKLLFDFHSMPYTRVPLLDRPGQNLVLVREGLSLGGTSPDGYQVDSAPYLMEYDNWGGRVVKDPASWTREELACQDWWGYDQIGWFANQPEAVRNHFLEYTYRWTQVNNPNAYFQLPLRRMLSDAALIMLRADKHKLDYQEHYQLNRQRPACPMGFSQECTAYAVLRSGNSFRDKYANPAGLIHYGARDEYEAGTGIKLPEKVVVYGSFQPQVGAVANDSNSEITRMYHVGKGLYRLSAVLPYAGNYDFAVSTYGTLSAVYTGDSYAHSGSGRKGQFATTRDNSVVRFNFRFSDKAVWVEVADCSEEGVQFLV